MCAGFVIFLSTLFIAHGLMLTSKLRSRELPLTSSRPLHGSPQPVLWDSDKKGASGLLSISNLSQKKYFSVEKKHDCFFDHSDPCPSAVGGRCRVDGRPCAAQRSYLRPKTFKNPEDLQSSKEHTHGDTTTARFNTIHEGFLERAERALRSETAHSNNRGRIQKNHNRLEPRRVERIDRETKAAVSTASAHDLDVSDGNSYLISNSGVVMMDWHQIKGDLLPNPTHNIFVDSMKVITNVAERIKNWVFHPFLGALGPN
jgi:hypothetical protein